MIIPLKTFTGEFPRSQAQLLPENAASHALDCDFTRGKLIGIRDRAQVFGFNAPAGVKSMFVYEGVAQSMYAWTRDVDAVRGPVATDAYSRFYWTDGTGFYVSRGDVGGAGQEPSTTNRYKVGVPAPAAALTLNSAGSALRLPGTVSAAYSVFCEGTDGSVNGEVALPDPAVNESFAAWRGDWTTGISCSTVGGSAGSGSTATGVTDLLYYGEADGFQLFTRGVAGEILFHHGDYLNGPLGTSLNLTVSAAIYNPFGGLDGGGGVVERTFFHIGQGWYCTYSTSAIPEGAVDTATSTAGTAGVSTSPVMRLTMTMDTGAQLVCLLRPGGTSTIPSEFAAYTFVFNYNAGALALDITPKASFKEYRAYTYTYVNQYGEESGPAEPFSIDLVEGQAVTLNYTPLAAGHGYCPISFIRLYRTATGSQATDYSFVDEFVVNSTAPTYTDSLRGDELGETIQTGGYELPPQNMRGLCVLNNGILAGFVGSEVYFLEPYLPYAHNPSTTKPLPHKVVGIQPTDDGLYVTTTAHPYLITGVSPDTMTDRRIPSIQAGVSKGSICSLGSTVAYASHDGIVLLRGIDASLDMSFQFFTRDIWRDRYSNKLSVMRMNAHDGNIVVWFEDGTPGFLVRVEEGAASFTKLSDPIYAAFVYPVGDALYVAQGSTVYSFKGGSAKAFQWFGKDFILPKPVNFGCIQMVGSGSVTYSVLADGVLRHTETVTLGGNDTNVYRLPAGFLCRRWSVKAVGAAGAEVTELYLAGSPTELQGG